LKFLHLHLAAVGILPPAHETVARKQLGGISSREDLSAYGDYGNHQCLQR
jgi:hypothetical protein